jgi:hypothetical protein
MKYLLALVMLVLFYVKIYGEPVAPALYPIDKIARESGFIGDNLRVKTISNAKIFTLTVGNFSVNIDRKSGTLLKAYLNKSIPIHSGFQESYTIMQKSGSKSIIAEGECQVFFEKILKNGVIFRCKSNKYPGMIWEKKYTIAHNLLSKKVTVKWGGKLPLLVMMKAVAEPATTRKETYSFDSPQGYFSDNFKSFYHGSVPPPGEPRMMPVTVFPDLGITVGHYIHTINDRFIHARENDVWFGKNKRWESGILAGDFVKPDRKSFSYEWHVRNVPGSPLNYYMTYQKLPGFYQLMRDMKDPNWIDKVRYASDCGAFDVLGGSWKPGKPLPTKPWSYVMLGDNEDTALVWVLFSWGPLGGFPSSGTWNIYGPYIKPMTAKAVKRCSEIIGDDPRVKFSLYDWSRSFDFKLPPYDQHAEWAARNQKGEHLNSFFRRAAKWWPDDAKPNYLKNGYLKYYLDQIGKLPEAYGVKSLYLDAAPGDRYADWSTYTWFQPYDRQNFKKLYRLAGNKELPLIKNSPNSPYVSGGYWEGRGLQAKGMEARWKAVGSKLLQEKIWQWRHRWTALLKWGYCPKTDPYYSNYIVGLGFKPHAPDRPVRKYAFLQAAYDMRHLRLLNADYSPCFWRNENTDVEAYLLSQGIGIYLSTIGHAPLKDVKFKINGKQLPSSFGNKFYAWEITLADADVYPKELNAEFLAEKKRNRHIAQNVKIVNKWKSRRIVSMRCLPKITYKKDIYLNLNVKPKQLVMGVLSPVPLVVLKYGKDMVHMPVAGTPDVKFSQHKEQNGWHELTVNSLFDCEIGLIDKNIKWSEIYIDGEKIVPVPANSGLKVVGKKITIKAGNHQLRFQIQDN